MFYRSILSKLKQGRVKILIALLCLVVFLILNIKNIITIPKNNKSEPLKLKLDYIVVHLDLKGAPPKLSYLESLLPMLKSNGVNGLLIEYEDMFPYEGSLKEVASHYCYKKKELQEFLTTAVSSGFEIIPLVQTFGHLEFVLSTTKFAHLREATFAMDTICPNNMESKQLLREMLAQVITFHEKITPLKYIHIGCDEAYHIKECEVCQKKAASKEDIVTKHIKFLIRTVHNLNPNTSVLIWDDMYREVQPMSLINLTFPKTEAVYWDYTSGLLGVTQINLHKYNKMFDNLWVASAFKGADGKSKILPKLNSRFWNHFSWLNVILKYGTQGNFYKFKGIILTGWSRYKHGDPLCELLPASIPSLVLNLILIKTYMNGIFINETLSMTDFIKYIKGNFEKSLRCQDDLETFLHYFDTESCQYNESNLYMLLEDVEKNTILINDIIGENFQNFFIQPDVEGHLDDLYYKEKYKKCSKIYSELTNLEDKIVDELPNYFEDHVVGEILQVKVLNLSSTIMELVKLWRQFSDVEIDFFRERYDDIPGETRTAVYRN